MEEICSQYEQSCITAFWICVSWRPWYCGRGPRRQYKENLRHTKPYPAFVLSKITDIIPNDNSNEAS